MKTSMKLTNEDVVSGLRPVNTLWNRIFLDPVSAKIGGWTANNTGLLPLQITLISFGLSIISALMFLQGNPFFLVCGAVVFQISSLADSVDGLVARIKPGSGSILALLADHVLDPWRVILNVLGLTYGQYLKTGDISMIVLAAIFLCMHFIGYTLPISIAKVRGAYKSLYAPKIDSTDRFLFRLKEIFGKIKLKVVFVGTHERELMVLAIGPIFGIVKPMLILGTVVTVVFFLFRLRFDTALVKNELIMGTKEYLGDSENPWEAGRKRSTLPNQN